MAYHSKTKNIKAEQSSLGSRLYKAAMAHEMPVADIASALGATRPTVYNWFKGGEITPAYRSAVQQLVEQLEAAAAENHK